MKDQGEAGSVSNRSLEVPQSEPKLIDEKRSELELGEKHEIARKPVKMRDLEAVFRDDGINVHRAKSFKGKEVWDQFQYGEEEMSRVTEEPVTINSDGTQATRIKRDKLLLNLDLNSACDDSSKCDEKAVYSHRGIGLDLKAEDFYNSLKHDPHYLSKVYKHLNSRDVSECGSTTVPLEKRDPLGVWEEMRQNGFMSSFQGSIPRDIAMQKQRGRKSKSEVVRKKMELAKREQVDRFAQIAAPSGLLNGLNPGIINHVRNKKQVHSIIEAIVRSENLENNHVGSKQSSNLKNADNEISNRKEPGNMNDSGFFRFSFSHKNESSNTLSGSKQTRGCPISMDESFSLISEECRAGDSSMAETVCGKSISSHSIPVSAIDALAMRLPSSTTKTSDNASSLPIEESEDLTSVCSLSVKAATVASQWLELLHQDSKGRLTALRRSKKRVRAVINTELPFLISKEFSTNQENDPGVMKSSADGCSNNATADMHRARWNVLFDQMDKALSEEEKQLESWLNQVKEMQLYCDQGLQDVNLNAASWLQPVKTSERGSGSGKMDSTERKLAVRAAAASIYSTSNFLLSKENVSCF